MAKRTGNVCLFHRKAYGETTYEVIIVQIAKKDQSVKGRLIAKAGDERYPSPSQWGIAGWTYSASQSNEAEQRFQEQEEKQVAMNSFTHSDWGRK